MLQKITAIALLLLLSACGGDPPIPTYQMQPREQAYV